jgi:DNA-binding NarL/FixJ family response regulator
MKAYIVEDNEDMRALLRLLLKRHFPAISVVGECDNAEKALEEIPGFNPDLVLVDISLPGMDGIEMIRQLKPTCRTICILVVTGHEVCLYEQSALEAGAEAIVSKADDNKLLGTIRMLLEKHGATGCG